jgi:DNA-binding response OmpR family regulator
VDETESVVRCIELGAMDYLPKPFKSAVLRARIGAALAAKRLRDLELEYLEQVGHVTDAAAAVESGTFAIERLDGVATRTDALGSLARVFQRMANEVRARETRLQQQVRELQIAIDEERQAKKVAEITESDYFQQLRGQAAELRRIME